MGGRIFFFFPPISLLLILCLSFLSLRSPLLLLLLRLFPLCLCHPLSSPLLRPLSVFCFVPPSVCPLDFLRPLLPPARVNPGWGFTFQLSAGPSGLRADDTVYSHALQMGGRLGLIQNCVTVHLSKQSLGEAGRESERGGGETGRETDNQLVREGWRSDSQCTITLVFRFGPSESSFWTHLCLNVSSSSFFFFFSSLSSLRGAPSNGNTFLSCLTAVPCLDFSLQTALHAWARAGRSTSQADAGDLGPPRPTDEGAGSHTWGHKTKNHRY